MNYIAHAYLSFDSDLRMFGNLLGDFVKGKSYQYYENTIQQGILLHRFIDQFTDSHPLVLEANALFYPHFRLSAGILTDILFDHFLCNHIQYFTDDSLKNFVLTIHQVIEQYQKLIPDKGQFFFEKMKEGNWLYGYKHIEGIEKTITGMCKRYPRIGDSSLALDLIALHYERIGELFEKYFPILVSTCKDKITSLQTLY